MFLEFEVPRGQWFLWFFLQLFITLTILCSKQNTARQNEVYGNMVGFMMYNATFNNNAVISWRSVVLVEETGVNTYRNRTSLLSYIV